MRRIALHGAPVRLANCVWNGFRLARVITPRPSLCTCATWRRSHHWAGYPQWVRRSVTAIPWGRASPGNDRSDWRSTRGFLLVWILDAARRNVDCTLINMTLADWMYERSRKRTNPGRIRRMKPPTRTYPTWPSTGTFFSRAGRVSASPHPSCNVSLFASRVCDEKNSSSVSSNVWSCPPRSV